MALWIYCSLMTLGVMMALLLPLMRSSIAVRKRSESDLVVYKDQLGELDQEVANGWLDPSLAVGARTEIQRRILARTADDNAPTPPSSASRGATWVLAAVILIGTVAGALATYHRLGAPALKGQPYAARQADPAFVMGRMVDALAAKLKARPDATGYATLAESLFELKRFDESIEAFRQALSMGAVDPEILASLGEAYVLTNDGAVVPEAQQAFQHALMLDRSAPRSRFYLGLARAQIGEFKEAVSIWRDLEKDSPADAPWMGMLQEHIRQFSAQGGFTPDSVPPMPPGLPKSDSGKSANPHMTEGLPLPQAAAPATPTTIVQDEDANTARLTAEQAKTIHVMVDGLAERLKKDPNNLTGWLRLSRSYTVLEEFDKAMDAARHALALDPNGVDGRLALADVQLATGKGHQLPDDFIATMKEVLAIDANNARALYFLGEAAREGGHIDDARGLWTKLLATLPADAPERVKLSSQIAALPKS